MMASKALIPVTASLLSYMTFYVSRYESLVYYCIDVKLLLLDKENQPAFLVCRIIKLEFTAYSELIPTGSIALDHDAWGNLATIYSLR